MGDMGEDMEDNLFAEVCQDAAYKELQDQDISRTSLYVQYSRYRGSLEVVSSRLTSEAMAAPTFKSSVDCF